jgi:hypothetical protein
MECRLKPCLLQHRTPLARRVCDIEPSPREAAKRFQKARNGLRWVSSPVYIRNVALKPLKALGVTQLHNENQAFSSTE